MNQEEGYGFFNNIEFEPESECPECGAVLEDYDSVRGLFTCDSCGIRFPFRREEHLPEEEDLYDGETAEEQGRGI